MVIGSVQMENAMKAEFQFFSFGDEKKWDRMKKDVREGKVDIVRIAETDFVRVTRCKDCKFYMIYEMKSDYTVDKRYKPSVCCLNSYAERREPDWYCADGERKE